MTEIYTAKKLATMKPQDFPFESLQDTGSAKMAHIPLGNLIVHLGHAKNGDSDTYTVSATRNDGDPIQINSILKTEKLYSKTLTEGEVISTLVEIANSWRNKAPGARENEQGAQYPTP